MNGAGLETQSLAEPEDDTVDPAIPSGMPVLVAIDLSPDSQAALIWACDYAKKIHAPLEILHVVHDPAEQPGTYKPEHGDMLEPLADIAMRKLTDFTNHVREKNPNSEVLKTAKLLCTPGLPGPTILEVARIHGAQHLVLGSGHHFGVARLFHHSTTGHVAGSACLPVTFVRAGSR